MTIVAGLCKDGETLIGWNNGAQIDDTTIAGDEKPWVFFGNWALGITGESSLQAIIAHEVKATPQIDDAAELMEFLRALLIANFAGSKEDDEFVTTFGIYCILVHKSGRIWDVSGCLSLTEIPAGRLWARGSGSPFAIGADYAVSTLDPKLANADRVKIAVEAAIANDLYCVGRSVVSAF